MAAVFFSYSHLDEPLRDRLEKHLAVLKRDGTIETWHDRRLFGGDALDPAIMAQVERADVVLCLVSSDLLASEYCYSKEMARALERHDAGQARVMPVILRDCDWKSTPLSKLVALPRDAKPVAKWAHEDEALLQVAEAIRGYLQSKSPKARPALVPTSPTTLAPAPGSAGFGVPAQGSSPRSSNLRIRKAFTDADRHRFQEEGFDFIARYFEGSLAELSKRSPEVETNFQRIDANSFTARAFRNGKLASQCRIYVGGMISGGIAYSNQADGMGNSFNDCMTVEGDDQGLSFRSTGMSSMHRGMQAQGGLSHEGAAEQYWTMFIEPLQR